jgi:hypothetical protein
MVEYETTPVCSLAEINIGEGESDILGILPFLSSAAATVTLAEIIKSSEEGYGLRKENFFQFSFHGKISDFMGFIMPRELDCPVCRNQTGEDYSIFLRQVNKRKYN